MGINLLKVAAPAALIRNVGSQVPVINDVVLPNIDKGVDLVKGGVKKAIELPICLEFGDC